MYPSTPPHPVGRDGLGVWPGPYEASSAGVSTAAADGERPLTTRAARGGTRVRSSHLLGRWLQCVEAGYPRMAQPLWPTRRPAARLRRSRRASDGAVAGWHRQGAGSLSGAPAYPCYVPGGRPPSGPTTWRRAGSRPGVLCLGPYRPAGPQRRAWRLSCAPAPYGRLYSWASAWQPQASEPHRTTRETACPLVRHARGLRSTRGVAQTAQRARLDGRGAVCPASR